MFNIGSQELLIILLLVFLLFGPKHIPDVARALGKGLGDLQRGLHGVEENVRRAAEDLPRAGSSSSLRPPPRADIVPARAGTDDPSPPSAASGGPSEVEPSDDVKGEG